MSSISSSSTTTLWATGVPSSVITWSESEEGYPQASKEWVIQPKPKPGRKPKKDLVSPSKTETEAEAKGRRIQNRAAQRAFRERKQSQLSELQARIQLYEQGEIERNVALQNVAKRLKEENERLRQENQALHARIFQMQHQSDATHAANPCHLSGIDKKRWRDDSPSNLSVHSSTHKKPRKDSNSACPPQAISSALHLPSPSSTIVSTPEPLDMADSQFGSISYDLQHEINASHLNRFSDLSTEAKGAEDCLPPFPSFGCGFCDERTICVCREIAVHQVAGTAELKASAFNETHIIVDQDNETVSTRPSILDNLPGYQPPVALRRRPGGVLANSVFPVEAAPDANRVLDANCSGDPSNCLACGDDPFGKAFCSAIEKSISKHIVCDDCPQLGSSSSGSNCCSSDGPSCPSCTSSSLATITPSSPEHADFMPTNDAWRKLKAHPSVEFADLSLLAEVVSSRSKCLGPQILVSPAQNLGIGRVSHGLRRSGASSPPKLVPQEVLLECGRRRLRQVHADGVREALRLLDAKFS